MFYLMYTKFIYVLAISTDKLIDMFDKHLTKLKRCFNIHL